MKKKSIYNSVIETIRKVKDFLWTKKKLICIGIMGVIISIIISSLLMNKYYEKRYTIKLEMVRKVCANKRLEVKELIRALIDQDKEKYYEVEERNFKKIERRVLRYAIMKMFQEDIFEEDVEINLSETHLEFLLEVKELLKDTSLDNKEVIKKLENMSISLI